MTRKQSPIEIPVSDTLSEAVMGIAVPSPGGGVTSVGELVRSARESMQQANAALKGNGLVALAAKDLMREHRRRGVAEIIVNADGEVMLRIGYDITEATIKHTTAPGGAGLPSLTRLRELAVERGIDISDLGRRKREIMKRLDTLPEDSTDTPPHRLRDEVRTSTPLPDIKLPR